MAKFYGKVGFVKTVETAPGVWSDGVVERSYAGDILQDNRRWANDGGVNDNFALSMRISIVADDFATQNLPEIRYVKWHGTAFTVSSIEFSYPRYVMSLGGVYNGQQASTAN